MSYPEASGLPLPFGLQGHLLVKHQLQSQLQLQIETLKQFIEIEIQLLIFFRLSVTNITVVMYFMYCY